MIRLLFWQNACLALALLAAPLRAEPSEADRATARELATAGYHALKRGDYAIAADHFQRADALVHAPTLVLDWGRALAGLGQLVEAGEKYELVIREGVPASAPGSWHDAHAAARVELEALRPRLAWLTVIVTGTDRPAITIDQARLPDASRGVPRAMNPGTHEIRVRASGYVPELRSIMLAEGARKRLEIALLPRALDAPPDAPSEFSAAGPAPAQQVVIPPRESSESGTRTALVYAAFAAGGAGLVVGGVTGALALHKRSELDSACSGGICPESERDEVEAYQRLGVASGIGFGVAAIGIGTGITLLLTESHDGPSDAAPKQSRGVSPFVGFGTLGVMGRY